MKHTNITDEKFWDSKYSPQKKRYFLFDPLYGTNGLLYKVLKQWVGNARSILELGCGSSRFLMCFRMVFKLQTSGIDFSKEGLVSLCNMSKEHGVEHDLYSGDMFENDLDGHKFDIVFHSGLVEHFKDLDAFLYRCRFFCKDSGLMIFFMPNMQNKAWSWHGQLCPQNYASHILYSKEQITTALKSHFYIEAVRSWGYPQIYAGGPPENILAKIIKYLNYGLMALTTLFAFGYKGMIGKTWASSWLFVCRTKGANR